ncbi:MAG: hypothetical protein ACREIA_24175 [Opitutaceae bacterium]
MFSLFRRKLEPAACSATPCARISRTGLRNPLVDTARLAMAELEAFRKTAYPGQRPPSLDEVCSSLGLPMHDRHTASGDTFTTAQVFLLLAARARRRLGRPLRLKDLHAKPL